MDYSVTLKIHWDGDIEILKRELLMRIPYCEVKKIKQVKYGMSNVSKQTDETVAIQKPDTA